MVVVTARGRRLRPLAPSPPVLTLGPSMTGSPLRHSSNEVRLGQGRARYILCLERVYFDVDYSFPIDTVWTVLKEEGFSIL